MNLYGGGGAQAGDDSTMYLVLGVICMLFLSSLLAGGLYMYSSGGSEPVEDEPLPVESEPLPQVALPDVPPTGDGTDTETPDATQPSTAPAKGKKGGGTSSGSCSSFAVTHDFDINGKPLKYRSGLTMSKTVPSWQECCKWCYKTSGCNAWSFEKGTKKCLLKNKDGVAQTNVVSTGYISGALGGAFTTTTGGGSGSSPKGSPKGSGVKGCTGTPITVSWYSWQNNSPCNSSVSASGKALVPFKHIAIPVKLAKTYPIGTRIFIDGLKGKSTAGETHSGWVEVADTCADGVAPCYTSSGKPICRLYIGDYTKSKASCLASSRSRAPPIMFRKGTSTAWQLPLDTVISCKKNPSVGERAMTRNYGGSAKGPGKCGDCNATKTQLGSCYYDGVGNKKYCS